MFDIGTHTNYEDPVSILNPEILALAKPIQLGKLEAVIYNRIGAPSAPVTQEVFRIGQRTKTALTGTVGDGSGGGWNSSDTSGLKMQASTINALTVGSVVQVNGSEVVVVQSVDRTANTINVFARGAGGSTAASQTDGNTYTIIGGAINDTDALNVEGMEEQTNAYENYVQLFYEVIKQTYTDENEARLYFDRNPVIQQEALLRIYKKLAYATVLGVKQQGSNTVPAMTAGLLTQLSDATATSGTRPTLRYNVNGAFSEAKLKLALDQVLALGTPNAIYCSLKNAKIIQPLTEKFIFMNPADAETAGTDNVTKYKYRNQIFDIVVDAAMPDTRVAVVNESKINRTWKTNDILRFVPEPALSSRLRKYSYQGKWGMVVTGVGYEHIDLYGIV